MSENEQLVADLAALGEELKTRVSALAGRLLTAGHSQGASEILHWSNVLVGKLAGVEIPA